MNTKPTTGAGRVITIQKARFVLLDFVIEATKVAQANPTPAGLPDVPWRVNDHDDFWDAFLTRSWLDVVLTFLQNGSVWVWPSLPAPPFSPGPILIASYNPFAELLARALPQTKRRWWGVWLKSGNRKAAKRFARRSRGVANVMNIRTPHK